MTLNDPYKILLLETEIESCKSVIDVSPATSFQKCLKGKEGRNIYGCMRICAHNENTKPEGPSGPDTHCIGTAPDYHLTCVL